METIRYWTEGVPVEQEALTQVRNMASLPIDAVMAAQTDLVEVVATLKQVLCVKG